MHARPDQDLEVLVLEIQVEHDRRRYTLCRPVGELDAYTVGQFREALAELAAAAALLIDLSAVPFMDSAGLGALIGGIRRAREAGGDVAVACSRPTLTRLLHTTGFDRIVPVTETVDAAARLPDARLDPPDDRPRTERSRRRPPSQPSGASAGRRPAEEVARRSRSRPSRSWTSVRRNGTRTTGAGATCSARPARWSSSRPATSGKSARLA